MWFDQEGVRHTISLPDPSDVMSDDFRKQMDLLINCHLKDVEEVIYIQEELFLSDDRHGGNSQEEKFEGLAPPVGLLDLPPFSPAELSSRIESVDWRWRLDVILALGDYLP